MSDEVPVKRCTAKRMSALVIDIFKGKTTAVERQSTGLKLLI